MLWDNLVCLDCLTFKSLSLKVYDLNLTYEIFDFIKILAQIINIFSKVWQNKKWFNLCWNGKNTIMCKLSLGMAILNPNTMNSHDCLGQQRIAQFHEFIMFHIQKLICKQFLNL
jgi:hypothetical protein